MMAVQVNTQRNDAVPSESVAAFEYTLVSADAFVFTHGFAGRPRQMEVFIKCLTAELGYAVGDEVGITASAALSIVLNSTQIKVALAALPSIVNRTNATATAVTAANWNLVFKFEL